ncbi:hypothetical protein F2Q69_00047801 [Brassica cretica]|uniref:Uncharacterized protein n=1 Tax=Brassica cretica TaxID=69181 RepID=A0A8S9PU24_BRACR|nr:hypothetical protein F2Q69_00047801 [Brassica cretica]
MKQCETSLVNGSTSAEKRWTLLFQQVPVFNTTSHITSKVKLNDYNKALSERQPTIGSNNKNGKLPKIALSAKFAVKSPPPCLSPRTPYILAPRARSLCSDRTLVRARSLRSDRAEHVFGCCVATLFELLSDDSSFFRKAFHKEESISKKYLSKKVSTFSSSGILTLTTLQPFRPQQLAPQLIRVETLAGGLTISANSKSLVFNMSSSHGDKRSSYVEMGEATSPALIPTSLVEAPACIADHLSFREKLVRHQAEKEQGITPRDTGILAGSVVPDASTLPAGSSTTPILVEDKERAADSMPPPPARKEIVLALHAPSVVPVTQHKGRKRKFTKGGDGESSHQGGSSIASGLRRKGRWSKTEAMQTTVKDSHSVKVLKLEVAIGELERDLGKTASSLLKEKKARKAKSSEVRRLQRQIEGDAGLIDPYPASF